MRGAFIVQLGPRTEPDVGKFEGCVEEVDSGIALRFHSSDELLKFLAVCFDRANASSGAGPEQVSEHSLPEKKTFGSFKKS
jgi:hypothetical protein